MSARSGWSLGMIHAVHYKCLVIILSDIVFFLIVLAPQVRSYYNDMKADTDRLGIKLLAPRGKEYTPHFFRL